MGWRFPLVATMEAEDPLSPDLNGTQKAGGKLPGRLVAKLRDRVVTVLKIYGSLPSVKPIIQVA